MNANYTPPNAIRAAALQLATTQGFVEVSPGVYLHTSENIASDAESWGDEDQAKAIDFSKYPFWLTTNSGDGPVGITGIDDQDLADALTA
ncbi:hypothetical protein [Arenimonas sp. MALMAid1274]|uniref:hypothetical protein n=1 Tax=Arenimonas sp. MALMAid1274 TaxID=3411630 RepID=UPI003BA29739